MKKTILISAILMFSASGHATCPTGDLSGDCFVGLADLAVIANQWMMGGIRDIVFVDIPSGTFQMGDSFNEGQGGELPVHAVTLSSFKMSKYEVTNAQYEQFDIKHQLLRGKLRFSIDDDEAVVFVDWHDAKAFCDWLSEKEHLPYRLPTERREA